MSRLKEEKLLEIIHTLQTHITETLPIGELSDEALKEQVEEIVRKETMGLALSIQEKVYISEQICSNLIGLGFLDLILKDDSITEVMINGPDHIFIEKNGRLT
ncbi:MAG TPA: CpaF family protein, partial [Candidatus Caccomorpha excrementavium]|nr:CpaF family protein [Candidatus Caccomorpha excrementavium]